MTAPRLLGCAFSAALVCAVPAAAEPSEEAVRFQYRAPPECPDEASFTARVRQRTPRGRIAEPGELARTFNVGVTADAHGFVGSVEFLDEAGAPLSRRVGGEQCESVIDSLALITALALDASLRETEPPVAPASSAPAAEPASTAMPPAPTPRPAVATAPSRLPPQREPWLRSARLGVTGGYDSAIEALPLGLIGQLDWKSWSLRLSAHGASSERTVDAGRRAELRLLGLESSGCYVALRASELVLEPCAWLDLGSLRAEGQKSERLTTASGKTIFWLNVGPELRVAWEPDEPFWLELHGQLGFPVVSHRFEFQVPRATVYEVPPVSAAAGVATGVRFW